MSNSLTAQSRILTETELLDSARQIGIPEVDLSGFVSRYYKLLNNQENEVRVNPNTPIIAVPQNMGFETGNFTSWNGYTGENLTPGGPWSNTWPYVTNSPANSPLTSCYAHYTIINDTSATDTCGSFTVFPLYLGANIARLNHGCGNAVGVALEQAWIANSGFPVLHLNYAVVLNDGGHTVSESSYFYYELTDISGQILASHRDSIGIYPGMIQCSLDTNSSYRPWQTDTVDLSPYFGQVVYLHVEVAGCIYTGHYGYCYFDASAPNYVNINESERLKFLVYPNPARNDLRVEFDNSINNVQPILFITDLSGREINAQVQKTSTGFTVSTTDLLPGVYSLTLKNSTGSSTQRFIIL